MAPYCLDIGARSRKTGRFIARVRDELARAAEEERLGAKLNNQEIGKRLDRPRTDISRQLAGDAPLTLRSVAELSWALGRDISFELRELATDAGQNCNVETTTIEWKKPTYVGAPESKGAPGVSKDIG